MIDCPVVQKVGWDDFLHNLVHNLLAEIWGRDLLSVLGGDNDGIHAKRDGGATILLVLDGNLSLRVRTEPWQDTRATSNGHCGVKLMGKHYC